VISDKQKKILAFPYSDYDAIICDGAIRSGKTSIMTVAFIDWAMREFSGQRFGICGKSVDSATKNIILPYMALTYARKKYNLRFKRAEKMLIVSRGAVKNYFEVFGGKDESSFALIQGRTLAGVFLDEVALMPRSFVEQALARCSVEGARLWFSCNPDTPEHWFYKDWIKRAQERNSLYLHFAMRDNPSLSEKVLKRYESLYSGVFYQRYIEGKWTVAEGLVYNFGEANITDEIPEYGEYYISCDYGTLNPFSAGLWCVLDGGKAVRIKEYYYDGRGERSQKTDEEYYQELVKLAGDKPIRSVVVDPSAASFIACIRSKRQFKVMKANNDVLNGIRLTANLLKSGKILIHRECRDTIREFALYRWDEKSPEDRVIKENDHAMDDIRYFCNTVLAKKQKKSNYESIFDKTEYWT
jgi:phage terminase, large subunit, PBSX family